MTAEPAIRRIRADQWPRLRALRLQALADAPTAYGSTHADEAALPDDVWRRRAAEAAAGDLRTIVVAEHGERWLAMASGTASAPAQVSGAAGLMVTAGSVWAHPETRGRGLGAALIAAVTVWAESLGAAEIDLWVTSTNAPAIGVYERCGFAPTGERRPLPHTPGLDQIRMRRALRES